MNNLDNYINRFLTFENPLFFALILSVSIIGVIILVFYKVVLPLQKKFITENQRFLLEKAELMALFAEMDPEPLIRTDTSGNIIQTNEASRKIFFNIEEKETKINEILPSLENESVNRTFIENINGKIFSVIAKVYPQLGFTNFYLHDITQLKKYESDLENYKNRLKNFAEKLDKDYDELKKFVAAELHDDIGQKLIMIKLKLSNLEDYERDLIQTDLETVYQRVRELSRTLKLSEVTNLGLKISIQSLVHYISESSKINGSFEFLGKEEKLSPDLEICIYRVIQESLNNIIKHSNANEFSVQLELNEKFVNIIVSDNGVGIPEDYFDVQEFKSTGTGLFSIKERIEKLHGKLKINSNQKEGTVLVIKLPKEGAVHAKNKIAVS